MDGGEGVAVMGLHGGGYTHINVCPNRVHKPNQ